MSEDTVTLPREAVQALLDAAGWVLRQGGSHEARNALWRAKNCVDGLLLLAEQQEGSEMSEGRAPDGDRCWFCCWAPVSRRIVVPQSLTYQLEHWRDYRVCDRCFELLREQREGEGDE